PAATPSTPPAAGGGTPPPAPAAPPSGQAAPPPPAFEIIPLDKFKLPKPDDYLRSVPRTRPRLLHNAASFGFLAKQVTAPSFAPLYAALVEGGKKLQEAPELTRVYGDQSSRVTPGSKAIYRIATLGTLYYLDQDPAWAERAVRELVALCDPSSFSDWYPDQHEVTADFIIAVSLGYDWFHASLNKQQQENIRQTLITRGLEPLSEHVKNLPDSDGPPDPREFACAAALLFGSFCLADEDNTVAKKAANAAADRFGEGLLHFCPGGIWPSGPDQGDRIIDYGILVLQTLRSMQGNDFGFSAVQGFPLIGSARMHLEGATGQLFNYGDATATTFLNNWVSNWLSGVHGNPGLPAYTAGKPQGPDSAYLGLAGDALYFNPQAAGYGPNPALEAAFPPENGVVATMRSLWDDRAGWYAALKGGSNKDLHAQLDLGDFVLEAGGQRWAIELGTESDRVSQVEKVEQREARYALYVEGTTGQNTLSFGANQKLEASAVITGQLSSPERSAVVLDLSEAYSEAKSFQRGLMLLRGEDPCVLLQDDVDVKNTSALQWAMHTRAEVAVEGRKATLTQGGKTLTAYILSPESAAFTVEDAPEQTTPMKSLKGIRVLRIMLANAKGEQRLSVSFTLNAEPKELPLVPLTEWAPSR
ncbi:MAG: hypothetical protein KDK99_16375, partial [Verrucomicrobiales bacterium]|nr:hypothetical protein [Verrucomicrobiales bacterium]